MEPIFKQGFAFGFNPSACGTCQGYCCSGESGFVWITASESLQISKFLGINQIDFFSDFSFRKNNRISLKEKEFNGNHECIFFDSNLRKCDIYSVRPRQCRTYPFWPWNRDRLIEMQKECPGISLQLKNPEDAV